MRPCEAKDCTDEADGVVGLLVYLPKALMEYYHTDKPLTRMIMGLVSCPRHRAELKVDEMFPGDFMDNFVRCCELSSGTTVDRKSMKIVRVAFDDPEYLMLLKHAKPGEKTQ